MLRLAGIKLSTVSIPGMLLVAIFVFQYAGFPILYFELDLYRARTINNQSTILQAFILSSLTITLLIAGLILARMLSSPIRSKAPQTLYVGNLHSPNWIERVAVVGVFALGAAVLLKYISVVGFSNIAVLAALDFVDTNASPELLRSNMGNNSKGTYHWYRLFMRDFLQIATLAQFAIYLFRKKLLDLFIFILMFSVTAFSMVATTEKSPIIWLLISLVLVYCIVRRSGVIPKTLVLVGAPLLLTLIGVSYVLLMGISTGVLVGIESGLSRILTGQISGLYHYLTIFPAKVDYLLGRSFPNPGGFFPWGGYSITVEVMKIVHPEHAQRGVVGSMPTFFWGEMYANFSYWGVIVTPVFLGAALYWLNLLFLRITMSPLAIAIYLWFVLHFIGLSGTGLSSYIIDVTGLIMLIFLALALLVAGKGVIRLYPLRF